MVVAATEGNSRNEKHNNVQEGVHADCSYEDEISSIGAVSVS